MSGGSSNVCRSNDGGGRSGRSVLVEGARFEQEIGVELPSRFLAPIQNRPFSLLNLLHYCILRTFV